MSQDLKATGAPPKQVPWGWIVLGLIVAMTLVLAWTYTSDSSTQFYMTVSEYLEREPAYAGKRVKVAGKVKTGSLKKLEASHFVFVAEDLGQELLIQYKGFAPDTFKEGAEVVVDGIANSDRPFVADGLMAKCASKYEEGGPSPLEQMRSKSRI